jgi:DNA-binding IclR family transcriptional regulator
VGVTGITIVAGSATAAGPGTPTGAQTLARGLSALEMVASAENGMTVQEVAERLGVHRTIASRMLGALAQHRLITRGAGGRYRVGSGLIALARLYEPPLKAAAASVLRHLADKVGATALVMVHDGDSAVAVFAAEPAGMVAHLVYRPGHRSPLDRGASAYALRSQLPPEPDEPAGVARARRDRYAMTYGEVTVGIYGVAAPIPRPLGERPACVLLITVDRQLAESALSAVIDAARQIGALVP